MCSDTYKTNSDKRYIRNGKVYVRTPEDEENDRREREWKERRNREALESFNRRHNAAHRYPDDLDK